MMRCLLALCLLFAAAGCSAVPSVSPTTVPSAPPPRATSAPMPTELLKHATDSSVPTCTAPPAMATSAPPAATRTPAPTKSSSRPTPTAYPTALRTAQPGGSGISSVVPAGTWVTSSNSRTKYYYGVNQSGWKEWAPANLRWFATEEDLLRAYPDRVRGK